MKLDVCGIKDEGEKIRVKYWRTILLLGLAAIPGLMRAQDAFRNPPAPPPEPNPLAVEVPRGGPVWITLSAYSLTSPIIRFRIREGAQNGKLYGNAAYGDGDHGGGEISAAQGGRTGGRIDLPTRCSPRRGYRRRRRCGSRSPTRIRSSSRRRPLTLAT